MRVPVAHRVGEENKGWDYAKYLLGHERSGIARVGVSKFRVRRARQLAAQVLCDGRPLIEDERFRERVAEIEVELKALEITQMRLIAEIGQPPRRQARPEVLDPEDEGLAAAAGRGRAAARGGGPCGDGVRSGLRRRAAQRTPTADDWALTIAPNHYWARHVSIVGGSNEIQRNILAKTVLGL